MNLPPSRYLPVNDLARHVRPLEGALEAAIHRVLARGNFVLGPEVRAFEEEFAAYCRLDHAVGVANGTDALELALRAVGVGPGDRVVTVANAGGYSTAALSALDARPVYADVERESMTLAPESLSELLEAGPVRAVIVTHLYGKMADLPNLLPIASRHGVPIIEDCAQAHGARLEGRMAGSWGTVAAFSFYPTKNLGALGDGGAVVTSVAGIAGAVRELRQYGWSARYQVGRRGGRNSRLDEIQAAVLRTALPFLDDWNARRRAIATRYNEGLTGLGLGLPPQPNEDHVAHLYVIRTEERESLRASLSSRGIGTDIHYPIPDHRQPSRPSREDEPTVPVTEECCRTVLTLPCFPELKDEEVEEVVEAVREAVGTPLTA
jgi:dTDP-4-amino-4,6-dideoxygalactose transaminase